MTSEIRVNKIANRAGLSTVEYTDTGIIVSGIVTCTEISGLNALNIAGVSTFASPLDINGDIDVDGHTNLDNLSVAGVSTFSGEICLDTHPTRIKSSAGDLEIGVGTTSSFFITGGPYSAERLETTVDCVILYSAGSKVARTHNGRFEVGNPAAATGIGATLSITGGANFAGIVTASAFKLSDGSNVGGVESDGSQNTVGGSNAGDSIVSGGTENTVFGYNAGTAISNGDGNTFIGSRAGRSVTTGLTNTGVGYNVMGNASGTDNAALGSDAGNGMGDGRWHVAIGKGAFANTNQIGSQQNNIVIGYLADVSSSTVSNEMTLGNANINHVRIPGIGVSFSEGGAVIAGVVTATSFSGALAASNLTGALPAISGANLTNLPPSAPVGGASTNSVFFENDKAVAVNYQVTSTKNAMSAGPIAINAGIAVTVPSGCAWTIV